MKTHIVVDSRSKRVQSAAATNANVYVSAMLLDLLLGEETQVYGDSTYVDKKAVIAECAPRTTGFIQKKGSRRGKLKSAPTTTSNWKYGPRHSTLPRL
jgi:IS5 family transposase